MIDLVFGLLDCPTRFSSKKAARTAREFSLAFTRFKYSGPVIEDSDPDRLLGHAAETDMRYCVMQTHGAFLAEVWVPEDGEQVDVMDALARWSRSTDFLAAGLFSEGSRQGEAPEPLFLVIDLECYRAAGRPAFDQLLAQASKTDLPPEIVRNLVYLDPANCDDWMAELSAPVEENQSPGGDPPPSTTPPGPVQGARFLADTRRLTERLEQAVFVWNIESYRDIDAPGDSFSQPMSALYTVAAGFKPNRILHTHGASASTRMVVFDYSDKGLDYRRMLHQDWDGADYPAFLRRLMRTLPPSDTHYLLWHGVDPEEIDWDLIEVRWQQELHAWGGAEAIRDHWDIFRHMQVEYLHCDLLKQPERLIEHIDDEPGSLMWWSNAFLSIHSIWNYTAAERREKYASWIRRLAEKAPQLHVLGADCNNVSVNGFAVKDYAEWLANARPDPLDALTPRGLSNTRMRY